MALSRDLGPESRRVSVTGGWRAPLVTDNGHIVEAKASIRGDGYSINNADVPIATDPTRRKDTFAGRFIPEAMLSWRYPLVNTLGKALVTIEPIANAIISPNGNNPDEIPNEDSQLLEFSDANLFYSNRFTGLDRVENGPRFNYGVRSSIDFAEKRSLRFLIGQNYSAANEREYAFGASPSEEFSDIVGRVEANYDALSANYRFRVEQEGFTARRNELNTRLNLHPVNLGVDYLFLDSDPVLSNREEVTAWGGVALNNNWTLTASGRRDLSDNGGMISSSAGLLYQDECLTLQTSLSREFTRDRDIEPATSIIVRLSLKNLN